MLVLLAACHPHPIPVDSEPPDDTGTVTEPNLPHCGPYATITPAHPVEGESVAINVDCDDWGRASFAAGALRLPPGATFDADSWQVDWLPDLASAGTFDVLFSVTALDGTSTVPETAIAHISVADAWDEADNTPVDPTSYDEEWGLPVLHLLPHGPLTQDYTDASVVWHGETLPGQVKIRGAASATYPKPNLSISLTDTKLDLDDQGLGSRDHLVLISNFDDNSYLRQKVTYDLWTDIAGYFDSERLTPRTFYVVVYLGGEYEGLYTAVDRIDDEYHRDMGLGDGEGNLYKAVDHNANFYAHDVYGNPKITLSEGYTKEQGEPIDDFTDLEDLVRWTSNADDDTFAAQASSHLDVEEFMDWWTLVVFTNAGDSGGKNSYLYHDVDSGLFRYSPWDFNDSWGQDWMTLRVGADEYDDFTWTNGVFAHILAHPDLSATLASRWEELVADGPLSEEAVRDRIDGDVELIDDEATRDWARWRTPYRHYSLWSGPRGDAHDWTEYDEERDLVRDWAQARAEWAARR
jgi:spore coat protein H